MTKYLFPDPKRNTDKRMLTELTVAPICPLSGLWSPSLWLSPGNQQIPDLTGPKAWQWKPLKCAWQSTCPTKSKPSGLNWILTGCILWWICKGLVVIYSCHDHSFGWRLPEPIWAECCSNKLFIIMSDREDARTHYAAAIKLPSCNAASSKSILCAA